MKLFPLLGAILFLVVTIGSVNSENEATTAAVRQMLLTGDDGDDQIDWQNVENLLMELIEMNEKAGLNKRHPHFFQARNDEGDSLDDYLTLGKQPTSTNFMGLSTMCDICASVLHTLGKVIITPRVWPTVLEIFANVCPRSGISEFACNAYTEEFGVCFFSFIN